MESSTRPFILDGTDRDDAMLHSSFHLEFFQSFVRRRRAQRRDVPRKAKSKLSFFLNGNAATSPASSVEFVSSSFKGKAAHSSQNSATVESMICCYIDNDLGLTGILQVMEQANQHFSQLVRVMPQELFACCIDNW